MSQWTLNWLVVAVVSATFIGLQAAHHPVTRHEEIAAVAVCCLIAIRRQVRR